MKEVSLACVGGGVKSAVNIGVIRALEEIGIKINAISGASLGSCVAILYCMGYNPKQMLEIFKNNMMSFGKFTIKDILCALPNLLIRGGIKNPKTICKTVENICNKNNIKKMSDFNIPIVIPSLDITPRKTIYYTSQKLKEDFTYYTDRLVSEAIRSSCSLPIIFIPNKTKIDNKIHHMMDGGITTNTPTLALREFSDCIIGVETKYYGIKQRRIINFFTAFTQTFQAMRRSSLYYQKREADIWIEVDIKRTGIFAKKDMLDYCEQCGYDAVMKLYKSRILLK